MKVFLSGSITSDPNYKEHFKAAGERFPSDIVFDPSTLPPNLPYTTYIKLCLAELVTCTHIYYVNDVTTSKGSFIERIVAMACGIEEVVG
jgi:hypothetical protein